MKWSTLRLLVTDLRSTERARKMYFVTKKQLLQFRDDSKEVAKKRINLDKPGEFERVVDILREWIQQQPHFKRKDFSDNYLSMTIVQTKGSIERAKKAIDKMCTYKTLTPQYFVNCDVKTNFKELFETVTPIILPKLTKDHHRVFVSKMWRDIKNVSNIMLFYQYSFIVADYIKQTDFVSGIHITIDFSEINLVDLLSKLNPMDVKNVLTIFMEAYGMSIQGIHCISTSKVIDAFIAILKQVLKEKVVNRIHVYKKWEELHDVLGKEVLPQDFGGTERSIREIHNDWMEELSSKEFRAYLDDINSAGTDESLRSTHKFNEEYAGMPGTFRVLSLD